MQGPEGLQIQAARRRAERQTSSCTECRRRKQKVSFPPVFTTSYITFHISLLSGSCHIVAVLAIRGIFDDLHSLRVPLGHDEA